MKTGFQDYENFSPIFEFGIILIILIHEDRQINLRW